MHIKLIKLRSSPLFKVVLKFIRELSSKQQANCISTLYGVMFWQHTFIYIKFEESGSLFSLINQHMAMT